MAMSSTSEDQDSDISVDRSGADQEELENKYLQTGEEFGRMMKNSKKEL